LSLVLDDEPTWQPLTALPMLTAHAAEGVRLAREHLDTLRQAYPYRLSDADVAGVIQTWTVTRDDLDQLFAEQGRRWQQQARGSRHQDDVDHYCALVAEERGLVEQILTLARKLQTVTIERLFAKSDLDVGLEAVLGGPPGWGVPQPGNIGVNRGRPRREGSLPRSCGVLDETRSTASSQRANPARSPRK
jgi:hypothetical protein